jgi:hypothetical protein
MDIMGQIEPVINGAESAGDPMAIALIGYSHGGGLAYLLSLQLAWHALIDSTFVYRLGFTAYIDAVLHPNDLGWSPATALKPETRVPAFTEYHANYYESNQNLFWRPFGGRTVGENENERNVIKMQADFDNPIEAMDHAGIDDDAALRTFKAPADKEWPLGTRGFKGIIPCMEEAFTEDP